MKKVFLFVFLGLGCSSLNAQYYYDRSKNPDKTNVQEPKTGRDFDTFYFLSWDNNTPLSNTEYIGNASNLGTKLGFRKRLNDIDRLWAGADFSWAVYKQYFPYQTYTFGTKSVSTDLYDYTYNYSLTAHIDYFFVPMEKKITPLVGFGVGLAYNKYAQFYNIFGSNANSWGLQLRPEAGVLVGFKENSSWRIKAAVHYDYASNKNTEFGYKNFLNYGWQIGIVKMAW